MSVVNFSGANLPYYDLFMGFLDFYCPVSLSSYRLAYLPILSILSFSLKLAQRKCNDIITSPVDV